MELKAPDFLNGGYADILFSGAQPSVTSFGETQAFRHYLFALRSQVVDARKNSFRETIDKQVKTLETARGHIQRFRSRGVIGQHRDFGEYIDVNLAALASLQNDVGFVLDRRWA